MSTSTRPLLLLATLALGACDAGLTPRDGAIDPPGEDAGSTVTPGDDAGPTSMADAGPPPMADAGPPTSTCEGVSPTTSEALRFDGDDYVTMGAAPALALSTFTLEAWVRRDGNGSAAGTGVGGLALVPIVSKGRGESDGSNVDCNYAFGLHGDVLGADFEDMASGANHPVLGRTAIARAEWHHVAATFDGSAWRLFVDGRLDGMAASSQGPRADSIQHFGIGVMLNSTGVAAGRWHGDIDEVRVFDRARTEAEIAAERFMTLDASAPGLVGRWSLDAADGGADATGTSPGTIEGEAEHVAGASLDAGGPPSATPTAPADDADVTGASVALTVNVDDTEPVAVTFFARALTEEDDFTIVVLPDTQYYSEQNYDFSEHFYDQTRWVMENKDAYDIVGVIHNGDIVNRSDQPIQWAIADGALRTLEVADALFPDGMPYGLGIGNHDQTPRGTAGGTGFFNEHFGVSRFAGRVYYGGHYGSRNDQSFVTFRAGGRDFVVVNIEFDETQDPAVVAWARRVFETHPDAFGILNSHYIVQGDGDFGAQGQALYNGLRGVRNLHLMTCGHITAEARRSDTFEGHTIHSMLADYQFRDRDTPAYRGGAGYMRIWEFSPANDELTVRTYSPSLDVWETDANSEFTLEVPLRSSSAGGAAGGPFVELGAQERVEGEATVSFTDLTPGGVYEWYAEVTDCHHTVRTPVSRFRVSP